MRRPVQKATNKAGMDSGICKAKRNVANTRLPEPTATQMKQDNRVIKARRELEEYPNRSHNEIPERRAMPNARKAM
jgi:hypothetical protein